MAIMAGLTGRNELAAGGTNHVIERGDLVRTHGDYHTVEELRGVMRATHVQKTDDFDGLKLALFEAFGVRTARRGSPLSYSSANSNEVRVCGFMLVTYAGCSRSRQDPAAAILARLSADAVKTAVLQSRTDSFAEAIEFTAREECVWRELTPLKVSASLVKADADQEDLQPAVEVTEATAATVTTRKEVGKELAEMVWQLKELLMTDIPAAAKAAPPPQRRRR
ncbi:transcriptional regulator, CopG/Arc/MetJ family [Trichinella spiralis]|uniref:transcriptional regulator, CopG/Arc/MetJ family n=1 Tax=Trichinella spiralis TaxID=6334 RepID=UPI0001EFCA2C|nr:transcriptional regulator, CopG/Arc/MetJ family [Trichinella spiralis]